MTEPAIFKGTFSDFRIVKGRKVVQILVEVPSELANAALQALGGIPDPANPVWVAVARIDPNAAQEPKQIAAPDKEKRKWDEMPASSQIAIACQTSTFREYLRLYHNRNLPDDAYVCDDFLKGMLDIQSKKEVQPGTEAFAMWNELHGKYQTWLRYERAA